MEQTPLTPPVHKKKGNKALKIIPWVGLGLFVVVVALGGYLYATKQMTFAAAPTSSGAYTPVCNDAVINKYNAAMNYQVRGTDPNAAPTLDTKSLSELEKDIPSKAGYAGDPTCQTILFWIAVQNNDKAKAQTALTALNKLHDEFKYVDSNLANNAPLSTFDSTLNTITANTQG